MSAIYAFDVHVCIAPCLAGVGSCSGGVCTCKVGYTRPDCCDCAEGYYKNGLVCSGKLCLLV